MYRRPLIKLTHIACAFVWHGLISFLQRLNASGGSFAGLFTTGIREQPDPTPCHAAPTAVGARLRNLLSPEWSVRRYLLR